MKIKKTLFYFAVLCFIILQSISAKAQNTLTINDDSGCPSSIITIQIAMNNATSIVAFQLDVPLPTGFSYVPSSITLLRGTANHSISASIISGNTLRILSSSNPNTAYTGNSGVLATFQVTASSTAGAYAFNITNAYLADNGGNNVITGTTNGTVTVNPLPVAPTSVSATATTICSGQSTTLSYTGGSGATFNWYTASCGGTLVGSGNNLSVSPTVNTTYYGRWENGCGNSTCQQVAITVNPLPVAPTSVSATATTICEGQSTTLSYTGGSGTTFRWFTSSCGGTAVGTGNNLSVSPTVNTTYYGRWENSCGNSTCQQVAITVNPLPVAPTSVSATATTICEGQSTTLSYTGGSGTTFRWFTSSCGGTAVGTGNNLSVSPTVNTTYYGRWENGCGNSTCQQVAITVNPLPVAPTSVSATATTICEGQSTTLSYTGGSGTTFRWFTGSCGGTLVGSGNNLSVSPTVNTTYYGRWENSCGNSTCQNVAITVNPLPVAPTSVSATATTICEGQSTTLSYTGGSGTTFNWYTASCGGTLVGSGNNLSVSPTVNTTYYGRWENGCGNSTCQNVAITVNPLPTTSAISGNATPACNAAGVTYSVTLTAGSSYAWTVPTGAVITGGATGPNNNQITVTFGNTNGDITVIETNANNCSGSSQSLSVSLVGCGLAANFSGAPTSLCPGGTVTFTNLSTGTTGSTTYSWNFGAGATPATANTEGPHTVTYTTSGLKTVSLTIIDGITSTETKTDYITVNPLPDAAGTIVGSPTVCQGQNGVTYSVPAITNATSYTWTYSGTGATITGTTNNVTINFANNATSGNLTVYGVNACGNGVVSDIYPVTVNPLPAAAGSINGPMTVCQGETGVIYTIPAIANAVSYNWSYSGTGATINGNSESITIDFAANATAGNLTVYGVNACGNGLVSAVFAINIDPLPGAAGTIMGSTTVCQGQTGVAYSVAPIANANSYNWSYTGTGAFINESGNNITIDFATDATDGILTVSGHNDCGNGVVSADFAITVNPLPNAAGMINGASTVCQGETGVSYFVNGIIGATSYAWSYTGTGASISGTTDNITIDFATDASSGNLTVYGVNGCGNGASSTYAITVNELPTAPIQVISSEASICQNESVILSYVGGSGTTFKWYSTACGVDIAGTGNDIIVTPTTTTTYFGRWENGCGYSSCEEVTVIVNELPIADAGSNQTITYENTTTLNAASGGSSTYNYSWAPADLLVDANVQNPNTVPLTITTVFTLTVEDAVTGCTNTDQVTVFIVGGPLSIVNTTATPGTICEGENTQLSVLASGGTGVYTYEWSDGGSWMSTDESPMVNPVVTTTYYVTVTSDVQTATGDVVVTVNAKPSTPVITYDAGVLTSDAIAGNQWYYEGVAIPGATDVTYEPTQNGNYHVIVTNSNGCASDPSNTINVVDVGVKPTTTASIEVYPNPNNGIFNVNVKGINGITILTLVNAQGKVVYHESITQESTTITLPEYAKGIYTLRIVTANKVLMQKIVVN